MSPKAKMPPKLKLATCSLAGCFGCHMSFLDMDEALLELIEHVQFDRSPLTDIKTVGPCDIGLVEGGLCNTENHQVLIEFRKQCQVLVAVGACAINGGIPALRNRYPLEACLETAYLDGIGIENPQIPSDPELPRLLDQVHPITDVVKVDYVLPGCPPPAAAFLELANALIEKRAPQLQAFQLPPNLRHFD